MSKADNSADVRLPLVKEGTQIVYDAAGKLPLRMEVRSASEGAPYAVVPFIPFFQTTLSAKWEIWIDEEAGDGEAPFRFAPDGSLTDPSGVSAAAIAVAARLRELDSVAVEMKESDLHAQLCELGLSVPTVDGVVVPDQADCTKRVFSRLACAIDPTGDCPEPGADPPHECEELVRIGCSKPAPVAVRLMSLPARDTVVIERPFENPRPATDPKSIPSRYRTR